MGPFETRDWWAASRLTVGSLLPHIVPQADHEAARLERLLKRPDETVLCFLGQSGIGKSTLINAIVADGRPVLPAGGTGPLTAIATQISYSERAYFRVRYQGAAKLRGILLNVERELSRQGIIQAPQVETCAVEDYWLIDEVADDTSGGDVQHQVRPDRAHSDRLEVIFRTAQMLVKGTSADAIDLAAIATGLRFALGLDYSARPDEADIERLRDISEALSFARVNATREIQDGDEPDRFKKLLEKHTAGALAPLVAEIEVGWPSPALRGGVVLVDLPGVGIAGDDYQRATHKFVRQKARGVVIVVRRGITRDEIDLVRTSGLWDRMLLAAGDPEADPCDLIVVRTSVDEVVASRISDAETDDDIISEIYRDVVREAQDSIRGQTVSQLQRLTDIETDDIDLRVARGRAAQDVLNNFTVHPVSAVDYTRLINANRRLPPLATHSDDTGIPALRSRIEQLGVRNRAALHALRESSASRLAETINAAVDQELAFLAEGKREKEELARLKAELSRFLEPLRIEYANRQGQYREFLESTAVVLIDKLVERAQADARKSVVRYLAELATAPWSTLKAAVVRGGAFVGSRKIDLPDDIAQLFQEPVAAIWGSKTGLLRDVRARTTDFAVSTQQIVEETLDWAKCWPGEAVSLDGLDATRRSGAALSEQLGQVGQDAADDLRRAVRDRLLEVTRPAVAQACRRFVESGDAAGRGVKLRIVKLCADLAADAVDRAGSVARRLLNERFSAVRTDISQSFAQWGDPLDRAAKAIAPEEYLGDSAKRAARVEQLENLRSCETNRKTNALQAV